MVDKNSSNYKSGYSSGYSAGRKKNQSELRELRNKLYELEQKLKTEESEKRERVFMRSIEIALQYMSGWQINGKTVECVADYTELAKILTDNSLGHI